MDTHCLMLHLISHSAMVKLQTTLMTLLHLLLLSSIAAVISSRSTTLSSRGLSENCDPLFEDCSDEWPSSPITSSNPFISRPFLRRKTPPQYVVVPSPPPVFTNPSFTLPPDDTNPSFSPLVASPPPPRVTIPSVFPNLPPADDDTDTNTAPPFFALTFSPPADGNLSPEVTLPPIAGENSPDVFMSPPPFVPIDSQPPEDTGDELPLQQPQETIMPPPVNENARTETQLPPVVQSPPSA